VAGHLKDVGALEMPSFLNIRRVRSGVKKAKPIQTFAALSTACSDWKAGPQEN